MAVSPRTTTQKFFVVVRETDDASAPRFEPQRTAAGESSAGLLTQRLTAAEAADNGSDSGEDSGVDGSSQLSEQSTDEVDVDAVANEIGVSAADLLRFIQENPQQPDDPRRILTMMACIRTTGARPAHASGASSTGTSKSAFVSSTETSAPSEAADQPTASSASRDAGVAPQLVALEFLAGENGALAGGEDQMTPTPRQPVGEGGSEHPSQIVFKYSGSNFSTTSSQFRSPVPSVLSGEAARRPPRGISFANNVVTDVVIYEVDQELYVGVEYNRHWVGWTMLCVGLILEVLFDVHIGWFVFVERPDAGYLAVQNWVCVLRAILSGFYMLCCVLLGIGISPSLAYSFSMKGFAVTSLMSAFLAGALVLEVVTSQLAGTPHFFTTSVLHCLWIVLYRVFMKEMIFFAEVVGVGVAVVGFVLANINVDTEIPLYVDAVGNIVMLISSILYAAYFLLQAWLRQRSPTAPMVFSIGLIAPIAGFILGISYGVSINSSSTGLYGMFDSKNIVHTSLLAVEGLFVNVCFLGAMMYLDVLSVSACYALKSMFAPMIMHYMVWEKNPQLQPAADKDQWGPLFFVGLGIVVVGSGTVIYFASIKRRFVARRIAHNTRKQTPNPYRKRGSRSNATPAVSRAYHVGDPALVQPGRSGSPSRRASVDSRSGRKIVISSS